MTEPMPTGFIGLGQMGTPMARHVTHWPGGLIVHDARAEATTPFVHSGARIATSPAEVGAAADIISVMVLDDDQVRSVVRDIAAVVAAQRRQVIVAVHTTIAPDTATSLASEVAPAGIELVDAPVSGGSIGAEQAKLAVMVGGSRAAFESCRELFGLWADLVVHMGPVGAGTSAKLARNLLHFVSFAAAGEAQRLAEAAGLDLRTLAKVVRHSDAVTGGAGAIMLRSTTAPLAEDDPLTPILAHLRDLGDKDLTLALELGAELGLDLPLAALARREFGPGLGLPTEGTADDR